MKYPSLGSFLGAKCCLSWRPTALTLLFSCSVCGPLPTGPFLSCLLLIYLFVVVDPCGVVSSRVGWVGGGQTAEKDMDAAAADAVSFPQWAFPQETLLVFWLGCVPWAIYWTCLLLGTCLWQPYIRRAG